MTLEREIEIAVALERERLLKGDKKFNQQELAERLEVSTQTIRRLLRSGVLPEPACVGKWTLAQVLEIEGMNY